MDSLWCLLGTNGCHSKKYILQITGFGAEDKFSATHILYYAVVRTTIKNMNLLTDFKIQVYEAYYCIPKNPDLDSTLAIFKPSKAVSQIAYNYFYIKQHP